MTFVVQYMVPLSIVLLAYTFIIHDVAFVRRSSYVNTDTLTENRKLIHLILVITTTFAVCVLPYHVVALLIEFGVSSRLENSSKSGITIDSRANGLRKCSLSG